MAEEQSVITAELMEQIEAAAVSAARDVISGRRIVDVEGPYGLGLTTLEVGNDDKCREPGTSDTASRQSMSRPKTSIAPQSGRYPQ